MKAPLRVFSVLLSVLSFSCMAFGDDEPPGPPGSAESHMKTLNQIEPRSIITSLPFVITNRGSYYLTNNLSGVPGSNGIIIASSDVDLDLNGYSIIGTTNAGSSGIVLDPGTNLMNLGIHNGIVSGWAESGVTLTDGVNCRLKDISAMGNCRQTGTAILVGKDWEVDNCVAFQNYAGGFNIGNYSRARNCRARENKGNGFDTGSGTVIENCLAAGNTGNGFFGQTESIIRNCVAMFNTNSGIYVGPNSLAIDNLASQNGVHGLFVGGGSRVSGNLVASNTGNGINAGSNSLIERNQANSNTGAGVYAGWGCRVQDNHATGNGTGFMAEAGSQRNLFFHNSATDNATNYVTSSAANFGRIMHPGDLGLEFGGSLYPWANFDLQQ